MEHRRNKKGGKRENLPRKPPTSGTPARFPWKLARPQAIFCSILTRIDEAQAKWRTLKNVKPSIAVVQKLEVPRLACSLPPPPANRAQLRMWESCQAMPLVGGFSRRSPVSPALVFRRCSILISVTLIGSQDLNSVVTGVVMGACSHTLKASHSFRRQVGTWAIEALLRPGHDNRAQLTGPGFLRVGQGTACARTAARRIHRLWVHDLLERERDPNPPPALCAFCSIVAGAEEPAQLQGAPDAIEVSAGVKTASEAGLPPSPTAVQASPYTSPRLAAAALLAGQFLPAADSRRARFAAAARIRANVTPVIIAFPALYGQISYQTARLRPKANRAQSPAGLPLDFRKWESCPDDEVGQRVFSPLHSGAAPYSRRFNIIYSQDLAAEEDATCIQAHLEEGIQKCSFYREQPVRTQTCRNLHSNPGTLVPRAGLQSTALQSRRLPFRWSILVFYRSELSPSFIQLPARRAVAISIVSERLSESFNAPRVPLRERGPRAPLVEPKIRRANCDGCEVVRTFRSPLLPQPAVGVTHWYSGRAGMVRRLGANATRRELAGAEERCGGRVRGEVKDTVETPFMLGTARQREHSARVLLQCDNLQRYAKTCVAVGLSPAKILRVQSPFQQRTSILPTKPRVQNEHPPSCQQPSDPRIVAGSGLVHENGFVKAQTAFHHSLKTYGSTMRAAVRRLASHLGEPGSIPDVVESGFWHVGIVTDDAADHRDLKSMDDPSSLHTEIQAYSIIFHLLTTCQLSGRNYHHGDSASPLFTSCNFLQSSFVVPVEVTQGHGTILDYLTSSPSRFFLSFVDITWTEDNRLRRQYQTSSRHNIIVYGDGHVEQYQCSSDVLKRHSAPDGPHAKCSACEGLNMYLWKGVTVCICVSGCSRVTEHF
ncbi:hypothetical protein PR048_025058 [Dryococelus australis]|uniref:Uncharacterized protein n=1 Tax=Dryococelus australis TaxID=614101 RepID=A0ABQ9GQ99_9NEOP|nr:hypothetical protein PR048_025058 [Dryococelus australis]